MPVKLFSQVLEVFGKSLLASVILCRPQRCAAAREDVIAGIASGESPIANIESEFRPAIWVSEMTLPQMNFPSLFV